MVNFYAKDLDDYDEADGPRGCGVAKENRGLGKAEDGGREEGEDGACEEGEDGAWEEGEEEEPGEVDQVVDEEAGYVPPSVFPGTLEEPLSPDSPTPNPETEALEAPHPPKSCDEVPGTLARPAAAAKTPELSNPGKHDPSTLA